MTETPITARDYERGFLDVPLCYRLRNPPSHWEKSLRLTVPPAELVQSAIARFQEKKDVFSFVVICLPDRKDLTKLFRLLAPECHWEIVRVCYALALGEAKAEEIFGSQILQTQRALQENSELLRSGKAAGQPEAETEEAPV